MRRGPFRCVLFRNAIAEWTVDDCTSPLKLEKHIRKDGTYRLDIFVSTWGIPGRMTSACISRRMSGKRQAMTFWLQSHGLLIERHRGRGLWGIHISVRETEELSSQQKTPGALIVFSVGSTRMIGSHATVLTTFWYLSPAEDRTDMHQWMCLDARVQNRGAIHSK